MCLDSDALGVKLGHRRVRINSCSSVVCSEDCWNFYSYFFFLHVLDAQCGGQSVLTAQRHYQKLQRRIANSRGIAPDASLVSPTQAAVEDLKLHDGIKTEPSTVDSRETAGIIVTKRKYRRHPKVSYSSFGLSSVLAKSQSAGR